METIMTAIKKAYEPILAILEANPEAKIKTVLEQIRGLASAKATRNATTFLKNDKGEVVAIFDYYFKRWMPVVGPKAVEFGKKEKTPTGFNNMSKEGVSLWTKQLREAKQAEIALLTRVTKGELKPTDIPAEQEKIKAQREAVAETDKGFATQDDLMKYLKKEGHNVAVQAIETKEVPA
jgi:hypothetical protein